MKTLSQKYFAQEDGEEQDQEDCREQLQEDKGEQHFIIFMILSFDTIIRHN